MDTHKPLFDTIWNRFDDFELPEEPDDLCRYARAFSDWVARELTFSGDPDARAVNQAKLKLLDKYFEWYSIAPRRHRYHLSPRGHTCIFQVFVEFYQRLKALELSLTPPPLYEPAPLPPPLPPPKIAGIFLGEEEE